MLVKRLKSVALVASAAVIAVTCFVIPNNAFAQGSAALSIVPRKNYTIEAGKTVNDTLTIRNQDREQALNLTLRVVDFSYTDDSGVPKLMMDEDAPQTTWSLKSFLDIPQTVTIEPNSSQTIDMSLSVPEGHGAGGYYSAIVYSSAGADGGNVGLSASGVTLVFANIPGEVKENLELKKLGAYRDANTPTGGEYAYFHSNMPLRLAYTLKNEGNVPESPVGSITLKPLIGEEITIQDINPTSSLALIGQERTFVTCIKLKGQDSESTSRAEAASCVDPGLWPGYYKVSMTAYYGQNGNRTQDLVGTGGFWYLPWWFILIVTLVLAFVGYHVWRIVRYIRQKRGGVQLKKKTSLKKK